MGLYLYCILPAGSEPPPGVTGIEDAPVLPFAAGKFTLWVSDLERAPAPSVDGIRKHNHVVQAAMSTVTPVPIRFGQWVDSAQALHRAVAEKGDAYRASLEQVRDAVEFGVRIVDTAQQSAAAEPHPDRTSGTSYLQSLAREHAGRTALRPRAQTVAAALAAAVGDRVRACREEPLPSSHGLLSVAHLVARHEISSYRSSLDSFRARTEDLHFLVSGPWPPYSFVG